MNRGFTPRAVAAYENLLRELTRAILDEALPLGEFDFVEEVATQLPIQVLCRILGVPPEDNQLLIDWGDRMIGNTDPDLSDISYERAPRATATGSSRSEARPRSSSCATATASPRPRRAEPRDDLVTKLVEAEIDGERLTEREFDTMFLLLVVAGQRDHPPGDRPRDAGADGAPRRAAARCATTRR